MSDVSSVPPAHTVTYQWQSFEMRMRQRRIERLMLRAEAALDADCTDGAQNLIEEIEQLNPEVTGIAELRARLADATAVRPAAILEFDAPIAPPVPAPRKTRKWMASSIAASLLVAGTLGWLVAFHGPAEIVKTVPQPQTVDPPPVHVDVQEVLPTEAVGTAGDQPAPATAEPPAVEEVIPPRSNDESPVTDATPPSTRMAALPTPSRPDSLAAAAEPLSQPAIPPAPPALSGVSGTVTRAEEPPPVVPSVATTPLERPETVALPDAPAPALNAMNTLPVDPPVPASRTTVPDDVGVRTALARYQSAYSRLDVDAAGAVWPALDRRALARAFDGLAAQRVDLGACDVRVAGETALAECTGSATWTPKVGGGSHSQRRRWEFRLRQGASSWQIVSASVK